MVIQSNMSPKAIIEVWEVTTSIFNKHNIPQTNDPIEQLVEKENIPLLLDELNTAVGSSSATCVEGG